MAQQASNHPAHPAHPRNWTQSLTIALLWLLGSLPWRWSIAIGSGLGRAAYYVARERRYVARRNLELCFPERSSHERERMLRQNFAYTGRGIAELALAWFGGTKVDRIPCTYRGFEHLRAALDRGQPVILLSGHFCCLELAARFFGLHAKAAGIYKPIKKKPLLDRVMRDARGRNTAAVVSRTDVRGILRLMRTATPIWYAGDQHMKKVERVFAPFFGIPTATTTGLPRLAQLGKALVLPTFYNVDPTGKGYEITIEAPLDDYPSEDVLADVTRMNSVLESAIRRHPTQYFWVHRRFKKRPRDTPRAYPDLRRARTGGLPWDKKTTKTQRKKHIEKAQRNDVDRSQRTDDAH